MERSKRKVSVNLFGLTGFGNEALEYLYDNGFEIKGVYTRKEKGPYPYFEVEHIYDLSQKLGIKIYIIESNGIWNIRDYADMNIVCTFHRIFKQEHLKKAPININIHPALLPEYRGKNPFIKMLIDNVRQVGITAHIMSEEVDVGKILTVQRYEYTADNESNLRAFLVKHIKEILGMAMERIKLDNKGK